MATRKGEARTGRFIDYTSTTREDDAKFTFRDTLLIATHCTTLCTDYNSFEIKSLVCVVAQLIRERLLNSVDIDGSCYLSKQAIDYS